LEAIGRHPILEVDSMGSNESAVIQLISEILLLDEKNVDSNKY
jgi:hypothetical protein